MKLKGLLKGFFILGLTLLPISFSSAYTYKQDFNIPDTFVKGTSAYTILNNFNISTTYQNTTLNHMLFSESNLSSNQRNRLHSFFAWYDGKPYLYADYVHDGHRDYVFQGFPTQFCLATAGSGGSVCVPSQWTCPKNTDISVFYNAGKLTHGTYYGYGDFSSTYQVWTYCVSDNVNDYCFNISASSQYCGSSYLTGSLNVSGTTLEQLQVINWSESPFSYSVSNNSSIVNPRDSAQNIYDAYRKLGYSDVLCYGGFGIDNIIGTGNSSFSDIHVGSGASIFDLFNYYSGSFSSSTPLSFVDWYNDWDFEYGFFYDNQQAEISLYMGKPKGFVGAFMIKDYFFKGDNFDAAILKSFCEFSFANDILIDKNKSPLDIISDSVNENEINKLIGNIGVIIPSSGSALDIVVGTLSGYSSENDFWSLLNSGHDVINSISPNYGDYSGILPTYIVCGFLLIFLFYIFRH